ncbi:tyrosine-protein phosphatase [Nocardia stercoris]|uniref:Tyrosine-protein phosphatase n=1 Tax=Nocardia stercoris TaxID=2483361 RepID=A0A3M2LBZ6_9NOCA|nr:tyrosine-protein phosphatase [Nocardia stercoris]RMI35069.1 tyrosine-protein phosphatase [Nocardia stercoris]
MNSDHPDHPTLSGTFNVRDLGGLRTASGATVRAGVLLRSAHLPDLDEDGRRTLRTLRVTAVFDLRSTHEIAHMGADALPPGVRLAAVPFDPDSGRNLGSPPDRPDAAGDMLRSYRGYPTLPGTATAITAVARELSRPDGVALVHCAAGKDRTGWTIATLLRAVGVTEDDILTDYLASIGAIDALAADVARKSGGYRLPQPYLEVRQEYLAAATESMHTHYGSLDGYLTTIGIDTTTRDRLGERLLS